MFGRISLRLLLIVLMLLCWSSNGFAYSFRPLVIVSGFGTVGYAILDDPFAVYRTGDAIDGADDDGSFEVDTRLGLQMDIEFNPAFSSTYQLIAREAEEGEPRAELEWGYLRWQATDAISIRAGRVSFPVYAASNFREVGYATPYLRTSEFLYALGPLRRIDGGDITLEQEWGSNRFKFQAIAGRSQEDIFNDLTLDSEPLLGIAASVEKGPIQIRLSHLYTELDIDSNNADVAAVREGIEQLQLALPEVAASVPRVSDFAGVRVPATLSALSLNLDFDRIFMDAEYTQRRVDNWVSDVNGWSISMGVRFGKFHPYVFASELFEPDGDKRIDLIDGNPDIDQLEAAINAYNLPDDQAVFGIGFRYNLSTQFALKAQVERLSRKDIGASFYRFNADDGTDQGNDVTLYSATIDFVF